MEAWTPRQFSTPVLDLAQLDRRQPIDHLVRVKSQTRRLLQFRPADVPAAFSWPRTAYSQATGTLHCSGEEPCLCLCLLLALTWLISWWASTPNIILLLDQGNKRGRFIHQYNRQLSFLMPNTQASTPFSLFGFTTFSFCLSSIVNDDDLISS